MSPRRRYPSDERTRVAKAARRAAHGQEPRPSGLARTSDPVSRFINMSNLKSIADPFDYANPESDVRSAP